MKGVFTFLTGAAVWAGAHLGLHGTVGGVVEAVGALGGLLGARAAVTPAAAVKTAQLLDFLGTGWKTVLGAIGAVVTFLLSPDVVGILPANVVQILMTVSAIFIALGIIHVAAVNAATKVG